MTKTTIARHLGIAVSITTYALLLAACGDGTEPLVPAAVQVMAGDQQSVPVGAAVPIAPSVKVVTASGKPVPNITVTFAAGAESGIVIGGIQVTDASGVATVTSWTLGTKAGASTLTATAQGVPPVTISATTLAGPAASASAASGDAQTGMVATVLTAPPAVRVLDLHGNPVPGAPVSFTLLNGGSIEVPQAETDANGVASAGKWTLGPKSGAQTLRATVQAGSLTSTPVTLAATAIAAAATSLVITRQPAANGGSGAPLTVQPSLEFRDRFGNVATTAALPVSATIASGTGTLGGTTTLNAHAGRVNFTDLTYTGSGSVQLRFTSNGLPDATSAAFTVTATRPCAGPVLTLDYTLGQSTRFVTNTPGMPGCLEFSATRNAGQQYLVMFENLSPRGSYATALFPGFQSDDALFDVDVQTTALSGATTTAPVASSRFANDAPPEAVHGWEFGGQKIYEIEPKPPIGGASAKLLRDGSQIAVSGMSAIAAGDTLVVDMVGIPRLGIQDGRQRAIVRLVTPDVVIAEDIRIVNRDPAFVRSNGTSTNTPIAEADLQQIAAEYAQYARVQADRLFANRHNGATTADPGRPIAIHSMMYADNIWGYTYSVTNYFVWDYWVGTADGTTRTLAQHAQRNADNLFMHEIAHMRHVGLLERAGRTALRGNRWLVEGFARAAERLPIAMRLLNTPDFSRTGNVTLPFNVDFRNAEGRQPYYYDDVPTYLSTSFSMYDGYAASAFVFDYFADQVAQAGGDWIAALAELLVNAGVQADVDAVARRYLGIDFGTLFTRARLALYLDDYGPGLPPWTQYLQYNLRASRPPSNATAFDPRNLFPRIVPGQPYSDTRSIVAGGAFGYMIDGTGAGANTRIDLAPSQVQNGVMSIVRIK